MKAVIVSDQCPYCTSLKTHLKRHNLFDKIKLINIDTKEGFEFAKKHNIMQVPECVIIEGETVKQCSEEEFKKLLMEGK